MNTAHEPSLYIGCAGWSVPKQHAAHFPIEGCHLERYAARFTCVEINSSFYRPHRTGTYARWKVTVPADFRFAVKVPKEVTHEHRLVDALKIMARFLAEASALEEKLGPLLVQLPPSLAFDATVAKKFFSGLRKRFFGDVACEPRHSTWFSSQANRFLADFRIGRVAADPAVIPGAGEPGGWDGLVYYRLHGSPKMYYSSYSPAHLHALSVELRRRAESTPTWCIFDNTALDKATINGLNVRGQVASQVQ